MWKHGGDLTTAEEAFPTKEFVDFSANINPLGRPESVKKALEESIPASVHYPDPFYRQLKQEIAVMEGVSPEHVICGNGAAELIYKIAHFYRPETALILAPTFSEYEDALKEVGATISYCYLRKEQKFQINAGILDHIENKAAVFLCNPNNPTGNLLDADLLEELVYRCDKKRILLVVDECFMDLSSSLASLKNKLKDSNYLILLKAFTKSFVLPGIRLGYALVGDTKQAEKIAAFGPPWSVSVPAQYAGIAAAKERDFLKKSQEYIKVEREMLAAGLEALGLRVFPSVANYILFFSADTELREKLFHQGILLRDCSNYRGLEKGYYRVAVRGHDENKRLLECLKILL